MDLPGDSVTCHHTGHQRKCREMALNCPKFVQVMGADPQTGKDVSRFGCADSFLPMLLIENSQQQRQTAAAVESFRNEMVTANRLSLAALARAAAAEVGRVAAAHQPSAGVPLPKRRMSEEF